MIIRKYGPVIDVPLVEGPERSKQVFNISIWYFLNISIHKKYPTLRPATPNEGSSPSPNEANEGSSPKERICHFSSETDSMCGSEIDPALYEIHSINESQGQEVNNSTGSTIQSNAM